MAEIDLLIDSPIYIELDILVDGIVAVNVYEAGPTGNNGLSAYQMAVAFGFMGTEQEWLLSLVGPQGPIGPIGGAVAFGTRATGFNGGQFGEFTVDDDYLYICVVPGVPGIAVWKKALLFQT